MKLLIFDMDGTLLDTRIDITISINHVRRVNHGLPPLSEAQVVEYINRDERNLPMLFYGTESADPKDRELFHRHYQEQCTKNLKLFPGIREMLETLSQKSVTLAIATNASSHYARTMIRHLEIEHYFSSVVGADTTGHSKPDPAMLYAAMRDVGFDEKQGHRGWLVGDSQKDMTAARNADIGALFAAWGYSHSQLSDAVLKSPMEIVEIIG